MAGEPITAESGGMALFAALAAPIPGITGTGKQEAAEIAKQPMIPLHRAQDVACVVVIPTGALKLTDKGSNLDVRFVRFERFVPRPNVNGAHGAVREETSIHEPFIRIFHKAKYDVVQ